MTQASDLKGVTLSVAKAGLTAGTTSTYTTTAATACMIGGKFATALSVQTNTATPTTQGDGSAFTVVTPGQVSVFVFCVVAGGTIAVFQGSVENLDDGNAVLIAPSFPAIDLETYCPFGYAVVLNADTGSNWTFGSSSWGAAGITDTFTDVGTLPFRPQSA